jgi:hypothetical protein
MIFPRIPAIRIRCYHTLSDLRFDLKCHPAMENHWIGGFGWHHAEPKRVDFANSQLLLLLPSGAIVRAVAAGKNAARINKQRKESFE